MNINTVITAPDAETEDVYHINHDEWIAARAAEHGFPIGGFLKEIYEDAVILFGPMFKFDWKPEKVHIGRVISILGDEREGWEEEDGGLGINYVMHFVLLTEDGTQVPFSYGSTHACFFALPENTEGVIVQ